MSGRPAASGPAATVEAIPSRGGGTNGALARAGLIVTAAYLASRILGWVRTVVFSAVFGVGPQLDTYYAAFRLPDLVYQLVAAGALGAAIIPVLSGLFAHGEDERAWRVVATISNLMLLGLLVFAVAAFITAPWVVPLLTAGEGSGGRGFGPAQINETIDLTRLMLLSPIFLTLGAIATAALNALDRFAAAAIAPLLYNLAIILAAVLLAPAMGVTALAVGVVVGAFLNAAVQLPSLLRQRHFAFHLHIDLGDPAAREALVLLAPRALGLGVTQITFLVNTSLAAGLGAGAITAYNLAFTAMQIPLGVIGVPLGIVLLPTLSRAAALGAGRDFAALTLRSLRLLLYVMLFFTAIGLVLRREGVSLLFDYGRFTPADIDPVADALLVFLVGLGGHALTVILARAFYARKDTRTPVAAAVLAVIVNVVVAVVTVGPLGLEGLALAITAGAWFEALMLLVLLGRWLPEVELGGFVRASLAFVVGAAAAGLAAAIVRAGVLGLAGPVPGKAVLLLESGLAFAAGALVYVGFSRLARLPELGAGLALVRSVVPGRRSPS